MLALAKSLRNQSVMEILNRDMIFSVLFESIGVVGFVMKLLKICVISRFSSIHSLR